MTTRRTVLNLEELGARVLPSTTVAVSTTASTAAKVLTTSSVTTGQAWSGQGRFVITSAAGGIKTYTVTGSAAFGSSFFAISGSIKTDGSKSGHASGQVKLSSSRGTLTLSLTGPMQSAGAALPKTLSYKVVSGTGFFAHYAGSGTTQLSTSLFLGFNDRGQFTIHATAPTSAHPVVTPPPPTTGHTVAGPSWLGHGRFAFATVKATSARSYAFQGSADFGKLGYFAISGSITTVGSKAGHASGRLILRSSRGTLTLSITGPTQAARSALPSRLTYTVVSGTGVFAHYAGHGTVQLSAKLFSGFANKGHFDVAVRPTA
jgi:hypothetical protein